MYKAIKFQLIKYILYITCKIVFDYFLGRRSVAFMFLQGIRDSKS